MTTSEALGLEIESIVADSKIDEFIRSCLGNVASEDDLVHFFHRFALYNQPFPAGVVMLAGAFHVRADLFVDSDEMILDNSDRSSLIASNIIYAAEDEYAGPDRTKRTTHRAMAQAVLRQVLDYAGWTVARFNDEFAGQNHHHAMTTALKAGYRIESMSGDEQLFRALGFHLGSERLADIEFCALNDHLIGRFPVFVAQAKEQRDDSGLPVYSWIETHTSVEVDHYNFSLIGAGQALDFYAGDELTRGDARSAVLDGFYEFVDFQRTMFAWLKTEKGRLK